MVLVAPALLLAQSDGELEAMVRQRIPTPVIAFIQRRTSCNHWSGEEAYDVDRGREIEAAMRSLKCERLEQDEAVLRRRYSDQPKVLDALESSRDWA